MLPTPKRLYRTAYPMGNPSDNVIVPPLGRLCKVRPEVFLCYVKNAAKKFPMKVCSAIGAERNKPCSKRKENSAATVLAQCTSSLIKSGELKCVSWPMAPIYGAQKMGFSEKRRSGLFAHFEKREIHCLGKVAYSARPL